MGEVASGEFRNDTRGVLRRVEAGEDVTISVDGRPLAALRPIPARPRWGSKEEFSRRLLAREADPESWIAAATMALGIRVITQAEDHADLEELPVITV